MSDDQNVDQAKDQDASAGSEDAQKSEDVAGLRSALKKERDAAKSATRELTKLQERLAEIENKDKSDAERLQAERDRLAQQLQERETRLREVTARGVVTEAAGKLNGRAPGLIFKAIKDDLEYDDDGNPTNVDTLLAQLKKDEPELFPAVRGKADGGAGDDRSAPEPKAGLERLSSAYAQTSKRRP